MAPTSAETAAGHRRQQLLLLSVCVTALVVAAFLAPSTPAIERPPPDGGEQPEQRGPIDPDDRDTGDVRDGWRRVDGENRYVADCAVALLSEPAPGQRVFVRITHDDEPATDRPVWFNGERIGRTNESGIVSGRVPYDRDLSVTTELRDGDECTYLEPATPASEDTGANGGGEYGAVLAQLGGDTDGRQSGNYTVEGDVTVSVNGSLLPGETATVTATVSGAPMGRAIVRLDDERIGRTDGTGTASLVVPERDTAQLTVVRGDFRGSEFVDIRLLEVTVRPQEGLAFPGEPARIEAEIDGTVQPGATVSVGGNRVGTAGVDGAVAVSLPVNPAATVTVETAAQRARVSLWSVYATTILSALALLTIGVGTTTVAHVQGKRTLTRRFGVAWTVVFVMFALVVVAEAVGSLVGLLLFGGVLTVRYRSSIRAQGRPSLTLGQRLARWAFRAARQTATRIERAIDRTKERLAGVWAWATDLPRSARGLAARLAAWLRDLPARTREAVTRTRVIGAGGVGGAAVTIGLATAEWGAGGLLASVLGLTVSGALVRQWLREPAERPATEIDESRAAQPRTTGRVVEAETDDQPRTLRDLWRSFARRVDPDRWQRRTPGEIARAAIDAGYPREQVRTVTSAFRAVEYGDRALSMARFDRVRTAVDALLDEPVDDEGDRPDDRSGGQQR